MNEPQTCREAVLAAMQHLERRKVRTAFEADEIIREVERLWPDQWRRSTIRTHVTNNMVEGVAPPHRSALVRVDQGVYRRFQCPLAESETQTLAAPDAPTSSPEHLESGQLFERRVRDMLSELWDVRLRAAEVTLAGGVRKKFDLVSDDGRCVGDAKRYTSIKTPAAKWSTIAEYVWLLQKVQGDVHRFLVFGGDEDVPRRWLDRFAPLAAPVVFYFSDGETVRSISD